MAAARPFVKICCIASIEEARLAAKHCASAIGLVGPMPSGPGPISVELAKAIAGSAPESVEIFLLTEESTAEAIAAHVRRVGPTAVQIVREIAHAEYPRLRRLLRDIAIVQVIHVEDGSAVERARHYARFADRLLLDSGRPSAPVAELGGTGRTHDWSVSRKIAETVRCPVYLAGGLNPLNAAEALRQAKPAGLDVCSGLRTDGKLDEAKLAAFMGAARGAA